MTTITTAAMSTAADTATIPVRHSQVPIAEEDMGVTGSIIISG